MVKLELTEDEREALLALIEEELRDPKFPLSPETEALREIAEKLQQAGDAGAQQIPKLILEFE